MILSKILKDNTHGTFIILNNIDEQEEILEHLKDNGYIDGEKSSNFKNKEVIYISNPGTNNTQKHIYYYKKQYYETSFKHNTNFYHYMYNDSCLSGAKDLIDILEKKIKELEK